MKKIILIGILVLVLIIIGCGQKVVCNKPYILVGSECCLDKDDNNICDKDEVKTEPPAPEIKEQPKEEKANNCGNDVCDKEEDCETCEKDCEKCFSLADLQADINKVIDWKVVLTKEKEDNTATYYVYSDLRSRLLGKFPIAGGSIPLNTYNNVLPKRYLIVTQIKNRENYIENSGEFYKYILNNKDYILEPIKKAKENFQEEFKEGSMLKQVFGNELNQYTFINISSSKETVFFDNVTQMETVGNKIVETIFVSVDDYEVLYERKGITKPTTKQYSGINYEHITSVYCSPSLTITLYQWDSYNRGDYDSYLEDDSYFLNDIRHDRKTILVDATSLISMCEQRYEFTYLRYR